MNLAIFFDPVPEYLVADHPDIYGWQACISIFHESFPSLEMAQLAIVGVPESRGTNKNIGSSEGPNEIRNALYKLKKGAGHYNIVDLGNLRLAESYDDTILRLKEVCESLMEISIIPIIIGGSQDLDYGQFLAYESLEKAITVLNIDSRLDMEPEGKPSVRHIEQILTHKPNYLFHYSHLGYQSFYVDQHKMDALEKLYFELYRLGQVKEDLSESEPIIRTADMLTLDISAIKMIDAPGNANAGPFGFTAEEACQLMWYAGINSRLSSLGIYEYNPELDTRNQTASVIATMIWYFVEGFYHRNIEIDVSDLRFTKYNVALKASPHHLVFYKDTKTDKWWMEIPYSGQDNKYSRNTLLPCSYKDYLDAGQGEIPNRWVLTQAKLQ
jgi:formiminoglutamase